MKAAYTGNFRTQDHAPVENSKQRRRQLEGREGDVLAGARKERQTVRRIEATNALANGASA